MCIGVQRTDQSHRIPSYQPDQLIEKHLHNKQCRTQYNAPSSIRIHILLSVYPLQIGHVKKDACDINQNSFKLFDESACRPECHLMRGCSAELM